MFTEHVHHQCFTADGARMSTEAFGPETIHLTTRHRDFQGEPGRGRWQARNQGPEFLRILYRLLILTLSPS